MSEATSAAQLHDRESSTRPAGGPSRSAWRPTRSRSAATPAWPRWSAASPRPWASPTWRAPPAPAPWLDWAAVRGHGRARRRLPARLRRRPHPAAGRRHPGRADPAGPHLARHAVGRAGPRRAPPAPRPAARRPAGAGRPQPRAGARASSTRSGRRQSRIAAAAVRRAVRRAARALDPGDRRRRRPDRRPGPAGRRPALVVEVVPEPESERRRPRKPSTEARGRVRDRTSAARRRGTTCPSPRRRRRRRRGRPEVDESTRGDAARPPLARPAAGAGPRHRCARRPARTSPRRADSRATSSDDADAEPGSGAGRRRPTSAARADAGPEPRRWSPARPRARCATRSARPAPRSAATHARRRGAGRPTTTRTRRAASCPRPASCAAPAASTWSRTPWSGATGSARSPAPGSAVEPLVIDDFAVEPAEDPVVGPELAAARTRLGLTVDQLAERTRIRPHVIESIEVDDFAPCGGDFYARGHLRTLARVLGVDVAPLLDVVRRPVRRRADQPAPGVRGRAGHRRPRLDPRHPRRPELVGADRGRDDARAGLVDRPAGHGQPGRAARRPPILNGSPGPTTSFQPVGDPVPVLLTAAGGRHPRGRPRRRRRHGLHGDLAFGESQTLHDGRRPRCRSSPPTARSRSASTARTAAPLGTEGQPAQNTFPVADRPRAG